MRMESLVTLGGKYLPASKTKTHRLPLQKEGLQYIGKLG